MKFSNRRKVKEEPIIERRKEKYMYEDEIKKSAAKLGVPVNTFKRMLKNNRIGYDETVGY